LRNCATCQNITGLIPHEVTGIFHKVNSFGLTMALGSTQLVTEMSTRVILQGLKTVGA
jgi:hypothetical protein